MARRALVVHANILIKAVFGTRVGNLIKTYASLVSLYLPEFALEEVQRRAPEIAAARGSNPNDARLMLLAMTQRMDSFSTGNLRVEGDAKRRMRRDPSDWPILAAALELDCPIWTDDRDFFGCGVATWTTANIEIYFAHEDSR